MNISSCKVAIPFEIPANAIRLPTKGATVTSSRFYHAGEPDPEPFARQLQLSFPADCFRYEGVIHPVDPLCQDIHFEIGIPAEWNGKLVQQGGAGVDGYVPPCTQHLHAQDRWERTALQQGYAVFDSDGGYEYIGGNMADFSWIDNEECFHNFAFWSLQKTHDAVAYFVTKLTGKKPSRTYFYGGSNGGRETMKAIQNFPDDYDGAICFFPVLYWTLKVLMDERNAIALKKAGEKGWLDQKTYERIVETAMQHEDAWDGAVDGVISDWQASQKKTAEVREEVSSFITAEQLQILDQFAEGIELSYPLYYGSVKLPGYPVYEAAPFHSQYELLALAHKIGMYNLTDDLIYRLFAGKTGHSSIHARAGKKESDDGQVLSMRTGTLAETGEAKQKYIAEIAAASEAFDPEDPAYRDRIREISKWMDAYTADLDRFVEKGGKLILVQGTVDPQVTARGTIQYYNRLKDRYGEKKTREFLRFYVAPGYGHGTDGTFLITADFLGALDQWVEKGKTPGTFIVNDHGTQAPGRTRPLYEYPGWPKYKGTGDINLAENYTNGAE